MQRTKLLIATCATIAALTACSSSSSPARWNKLTGLDGYGLTTNTPAGSDLYYTDDSNVQKYTIASDTWGLETDSVSLPGGYDYGAIVGDHIYAFGDTELYDYSISGQTASSATIDGMPSVSNSETAVDDDGNLWTYSTETNQLIEYNPDTEDLSLFDDAAETATSEPRVAWDTSTQLIYVGDYDGTLLSQFDPVAEEFTALADFPDAAGASDAFCSDGAGHLYTLNSDGTKDTVYKYTASADAWTKMKALPFDIGDSASCTVADGHLYMLGDGNMARLKI